MKLRLRLSDITDIQIGYQHRDKSRPITMGTTGSHAIIQIKDLDAEERFKEVVLKGGGSAPYVWAGSLYQVTPSGDPERYLVTQGNVIFLYRGKRLSAVPITEKFKDTVAAYHFYILKPDESTVLPEYLAWFLNHPRSQAFLECRLRGAHIPMIPKGSFSELEVSIPPLEKQRSIVELERLRQKEEFIIGQLAHARKRLVHGLCYQAATSTGQ